jgi:hypothetical protein
MMDKVTVDFYTKDLFDFCAYTNSTRWISYYYQISETLKILCSLNMDKAKVLII